MCGIIGGITGENFDQKAVLDTIAHRGPDNKGFFKESNVFLGHTRLSIQDLSERANQPMFSQDGKYVIIFNGEIYNHQEIRKKNLSQCIFNSSGDTETVLQAYIKFGESCLNLFNGIFAFAIFNISTKDIFIARDHFGVKPLYLYCDERKFLFGSEIKSFLEFDIDHAICYEAIVNYLTFLWSPGEMTPFKKVTKMLPGSYLKFNINSYSTATPIKYYHQAPNGQYLDLTEDQIINQLDDLLNKAVERQLLSDVPVGFFLSGGLDSTLLVAIAKKLHPEKRFPCFTIDVSGWKSGTDGFTDDLDYAKKAAEFLNVDLSIVKADIDIVRDFDKMIWHLDEPQADAAPLNVLNIASLARDKHIKVLIGGAAGDDIFSGYRRHIALKFEPIFEKIPSRIKKIAQYVIGLLPVGMPLFRRLKKIAKNIDKSQSERLIGYFDWIDISIVKQLFDKKHRLIINNYDHHSYFNELLAEVHQEDSLLQKMLFLELKTFLVDHNLNYTDKMSMAVGVEARVPYLDTELVSYAQRIPPEFKYKNGETKYILKKLAERYLPKEIIYRPKTGFGAPVRKWIMEDMTEIISDRLSKENIKQQGIFDHDKVWNLIEKNKAGEIDASYTIWAILAVSSWISQFTKKKN
jgi:asparagine synthase (glutamine-hydrolysing)